ncbi:hypothetical protein HN385_03520 [archaeon]|jgi:hypothetical protein|nr:hypothetical protein [archaeon]MBT6869766.1 hypothetical protein [archaeon]MBT7192721.1 hypothetical protein [archaeon]MBT7380746.1 hypothetical protein [archaeon]MBT7508318.1 hypothetical protein [archaeon]
MAKDDKPKSVDDIVSGYQKFHHKLGKNFKERIGQFEKLHDPENIHMQQFQVHAHYTVFGKPGSEKDFPGAYNSAFKTLDGLKNKDGSKFGDGDKIDHEDDIAKILESYVDTFLQKALGDKFNKHMEQAKKEGIKGKDLRKLKGSLMGMYHTDERGNPINILEDNYINKLKGKKKIKLISELQNLGSKIVQGYTSHLKDKALEGLISEDDRLDMATYITPVFNSRGMKPADPFLTKSATEQSRDYGILLQGGSNILQEKLGYEVIKPEQKKEKKS